MKKLSLLITLFVFAVLFVFAQNDRVLVTQTTVKVAGMGTKELYFGFDAGDKIIFNFQLVKGKNLKEIEIIEYPNSSIFMDYKTTEIKDKSIIVNRKGIYKFYFKNSSMSARICKVKIERIPAASGNTNFNTTVYWKTMRDTDYYFVDEKYLISKDTSIVSIIDHRVERVHSETNLEHSNTSIVELHIPNNTIFWSYYIGVGENSEQIFRKAEEDAKKEIKRLKSAAKVTSVLSKFDPSGSAALATLALNGYANFGVVGQADNVQYWFVPDYTNAQLLISGSQFKYLSKGDGPLSKGRMTYPQKGTVYLCMKNDNIRKGIDVHIRASAVTVKENWGIRKVKKYKVRTWKKPYLKE